MSTTPAGWYPDPEREGATRWWDGAQWAPSQDAASADDRFRPRDDASSDASGAADPGLEDTVTPGGDDPSWSPTSGNDWGQQSFTASEPSWGAPATSASAPAYGQDAGGSWDQQGSTPAWEQQGQAPQYGSPQYGAPQYGQQPGAEGQQSWNQYGQQPKKSRTGLFVGIGAGVLVLLLLVVGGGIFLATNLIGNVTTQTQTQGGGTGGGGGGGTQGPGSWEVEVGAGGGQSVTEFEITAAGNYEISVVALNDGDPRITVSGNGQTWEDDDSGEGTDSLLTASLSPGTYTIAVEEYFDDALVASITVTQR